MLDRTRSVFLAAIVASAALIVDPCTAQCTTGWQSGLSVVPGPDDGVWATTNWDPDGAGPLPTALVVGGDFSFVAGTVTNAIAVLDTTTGNVTSLGGGMNGQVRALAVLPNGNLVAAGGFTTAGGVPAIGIAQWNGSAWLPLGGGLMGTVTALVVMPNGDLVAGGTFVAGAGMNRIARWNGTAWAALGNGMNNTVVALAVMPNGDLVAGGNFTSPAYAVALWNGFAWGAMTTYFYNAQVAALLVRGNGDLIAAGFSVHRWTGSNWAVLGGGIYTSFTTVQCLAETPGGDLFAGGSFPTITPGLVANQVARLVGASWTTMGSGVTAPPTSPAPVAVHTMAALPNGDVVAGGHFTTAGITSARNLARWNGTSWSSAVTGSGFDASILAAARLPNGNLAVGGVFMEAPGPVAAFGIAEWNGAAWSPLASGISYSRTTASQDPVRALVALPNGDLVAGGTFTSAGSVAAANIARWNGTTWSAVGLGTNGTVFALATLGNGDLVAGGQFVVAGGTLTNNIARWNGTFWSSLAGGTNGIVQCLVRLPNGDLIAGGSFTIAGGLNADRIARWNGSTWASIGSMSGTVSCLAVLPNGDLVAGGEFTVAGGSTAARIARWNGSNWNAMGAGMSGPVRSLVVLPDGDLLAGGAFITAGGTAANRIARWNGTSWSAAGDFDADVLALAVDAQGVPFAGGAFANAMPGVPSVSIARMTTNCPASASLFGAGCPSSGGSNTLVATTMPWLDTTFVATGTGLPTSAYVFAVTSGTPIVPGFGLSSVFAQAPAGCDLHVAPDIVTGVATSTGTVQSQIFLANVPALVGVTFYHQLVVFDAAGPITATNALQLVAGIL